MFGFVLPDLVFPLLIFCARVCDVTLGTFRTISVVRGKKALAWMLGFVEITIWVLVVREVLTSLDSWVNVFAYSLGFATGSAVGIALENRLAIGNQMVRIVSRFRGNEIAEKIRQSGQAVTEFNGEGRDGPIKLLYVFSTRKQTPLIALAAESVDPECFITIEDAKQSNRRLRPRPAMMFTGWRSVSKRK